MSTQERQRVGRFYTAARRHPWVLGKIGDFRLWLGPYNAVQIAVAVFGALVLINTVAWWSPLGPIPLVAWALAIWVVRRPRIAGRSPLAAAAGWLMALAKPAPGRIAGRPARDKAAHALLGGFVIEDLPQARASAHPPRRRSCGHDTDSSLTAPKTGAAQPHPLSPGKVAQPSRTTLARPKSRPGRRRTQPPDPANAPASAVQLLRARSAAVQEGAR